MSTATLAPVERHWTAIGGALHVTSSKTKRNALLKAAAAMAWVTAEGAIPAYENPAVALVVGAVFKGRECQLARVAKADLPGHQALIGLEDTAGRRCYVVEDHSEAIYVLLEHSARSAA
jgi:hypothetical protein